MRLIIFVTNPPQVAKGTEKKQRSRVKNTAQCQLITMNLRTALSLLLTTATVSSVAGFSVVGPHSVGAPPNKRTAFLAKGIQHSSASSRLSPLKMSETVEKKDEETFE